MPPDGGSGRSKRRAKLDTLPRMEKSCRAFFFLRYRRYFLPIQGAKISAATAARSLLLVANQDDHDLSIIDPAAGRQIAIVPESGVTGHEVAASPDGRTAYVPIYGDSGVGKPGSDGAYMDVVDIAGRKVIGKIDFGHGVRPHLPVYDPVSGMLYVTTNALCSRSGSVGGQFPVIRLIGS